MIPFSLEIAGPPPPGGYRLLFPYIVGDLYGSPTTGAFVHPIARPGGRFELDLNRTYRDLRRELAATDFSLGFLRITPPQARIARLAPLALERGGIEPVGTAEWLDARTGRALMLIYFDRPARIEGGLTRGGETVRYAIAAPKAGYLWVGSRMAAPHEMLFGVVPRPRRLILRIRTSGHRPSGQSAGRAPANPHPRLPTPRPQVFHRRSTAG